MSSEQRSPSAVHVVYSATVVSEEALGEDIQQLLQPVVSYSVYSTISNTITRSTSPHIFEEEETMEGGASDITQ